MQSVGFTVNPLRSSSCALRYSNPGPWKSHNAPTTQSSRGCRLCVPVVSVHWWSGQYRSICRPRSAALERCFVNVCETDDFANHFSFCKSGWVENQHLRLSHHIASFTVAVNLHLDARLRPMSTSASGRIDLAEVEIGRSRPRSFYWRTCRWRYCRNFHRCRRCRHHFMWAWSQRWSSTSKFHYVHRASSYSRRHHRSPGGCLRSASSVWLRDRESKRTPIHHAQRWYMCKYVLPSSWENPAQGEIAESCTPVFVSNCVWKHRASPCLCPCIASTEPLLWWFVFGAYRNTVLAFRSRAIFLFVSDTSLCRIWMINWIRESLVWLSRCFSAEVFQERFAHAHHVECDLSNSISTVSTRPYHFLLQCHVVRCHSVDVWRNHRKLWCKHDPQFPLLSQIGTRLIFPIHCVPTFLAVFHWKYPVPHLRNELNFGCCANVFEFGFQSWTCLLLSLSLISVILDFDFPVPLPILWDLFVCLYQQSDDLCPGDWIDFHWIFVMCVSGSSWWCVCSSSNQFMLPHWWTYVIWTVPNWRRSSCTPRRYCKRRFWVLCTRIFSISNDSC